MFNAGVRGKRAKDSTGLITVGEHFNQQTFLVPTVTRFAVTDGSYVDTNDTAADPAGNQVIVLYGSGFAPGATVLVGSTTIGAVTFLDSGRLTFSSPALGSGSYTVFVTNVNGGTGILVPGLVYSGVPTFTTAAGSLGSVYETTAISTTVVATGDAPITYAISSGSLPSGSTLSSGGAISGTAPVDGSSTTYSFTVQATDAQNQDSVRSFSLTINTDVVSFSSPANNTTTSATQNTAISNVTVTATSAAGYGVLYTSSGLPTGLSMNTSTGIISGTPTVVASNTSIITATANTTSRTAALYLNWTINLPGDLFWKYASLLLSANTVPKGNTFNTDLSTFNNEIVVVADTKPNEFHPFKEGYYSNYFDGTGDYLAILTNAAFNIGTNSFTVEAWINTSSATQQSIFNISDTASSGYGAVRVQVLSNQTVQWLMGPGGSWGVAVTAGSITLGTWNHIAITRNGSSVYFFINGLQVGTTQTYATSLTTGGTTYIGYNSGTAFGFNGYISNLRFINGTALYTANTTLSTSPLTYVANTSLLTCQSNKLIDNSNNNFTIVKGGDTTVNPFSPFNGTPTTITVPAANNYSMYFDGTGDYISAPGSSSFAFGTGNFTVEFWMYCNVAWAGQTNPGVVGQKQGDGTAGWQIYRNGGSNDMYVRIVNTNDYGSGVTPATRIWEHWALVRSGSDLTWYRNGTATYTHTGFSQNITDTAGLLYIGYTQTWAGTLNATLSNLRIVKGTAVYTGNFTVPTSPLSRIQSSGTNIAALTGTETVLLTCQDSTIKDNSASPVTFTVVGDARPARNGPFANTTTVTLIGNDGSAYFDGTGDYLEIAHAGNQWIGASTDFTIECWFYFTGPSGNERVLFSKGYQGSPAYSPYVLRIEESNKLQFLSTTSGGSWEINIIDAVAVVSNSWIHVAVCRSGSTITMYKNGVSVGTPVTNSNALYNHTGTIRIGSHNGGSPFLGYISNVRFVKGTALYTTPFVPTWAPLTPVANTVLLTAQTNLSSNTKVIVDESNINSVVTGFGNTNLGSFSPFGSTWSGYFDGANDFLSIPTSSSFNFGTGDFTVECWVNWSSTTTDRGIISRYAGASSGWALRYDNTSGPTLNWINGDTSILIASHTPIAGTWYHYAVCRSGTTLRIFINGTQSASTTYSGNQDTSSTLYIGQLSNTLWPVNGYISNVRILKGTALYTAAFTPSTNPLLPVANTILLTCNSNKFVDYSAANNVITKGGDGASAVSKFSPFSSVTVTPASYSGYFDGTGDYLITPASQTAANLTGDFTVEFWFYRTVNVDVIGLFGIGSSDPDSNLIRINGGVLQFWLGGSNGGASGTGTKTGQVNCSTTLLYNRWYHVAWVRSGSSTNNVKLYLNGVLDGQGTGTYQVPANYIGVGLSYPTYNGEYFNGYISNLRVVKGQALYTETFTPSTTPLTAVANTVLLTCQSNTFLDNSSNPIAITVNGNAKPVIQNPFTDTVSTATNYSANTFGNSIYFDGTGDYASYTASLLIAGTFTAECWFYNTSTSGTQQTLFAFNSTSGAYASIRVDCDGSNASNHMQALLSTGGSAWNTNIGVNNAYVKGVWNHVAVTRDSSNLVRFFVNGVVIGTATQTGTLYNTSTIHGIGTNNLPGAISNPFQGYISNLRMTNGQALYTGPFVPSNQPAPVTSNTTLLLASTVGPSVTDATRNHNIETFGTARYVANNSPYYDTYSAYFDGTGDYLSIAATSAFANLWFGDVTVECWVYFNSVSSTPHIWSFSESSSIRVTLYVASSVFKLYTTVSTGSDIITSATTLTTGRWYHVAITKNSGTWTMWLNGVSQGTSTSTNRPYGVNEMLAIGTQNYSPGAGDYLNGYISNLRAVSNTAVYTSTFTPPTAPLTAIANTSLLTCQSNRFIDNSTNAFTITKFGDAKITSVEPFVDSNNSRFSSVYFGTKTDYLGIRTQPSLTTFPGDFTFECWVYPTDTTLSNTWGIWDSRQAGATTNPMIFCLIALASPVSGSWRLSYYNGTQHFGTGTVLSNQWTHVAWVRSGTTMTFYVNGVAGGTTTISGTQTATATSNPIYIGTKDNGLSGYGTVGYIADFRITNGYARTITVPTAPYDIK